MATYKTAPLTDYNPAFQDVARRLFETASSRLVDASAVEEKGSYSFRPRNLSQETIVKIVVFQHHLGVQMQGELPWRNDGVYVLVRSNGAFGDIIWSDPLLFGSPFCTRMSRDENVGTAPNFDARFAYFPVMAGESLDAIAEFVSSIVERANQQRPKSQAVIDA